MDLVSEINVYIIIIIRNYKKKFFFSVNRHKNKTFSMTIIVDVIITLQ